MLGLRHLDTEDSKEPTMIASLSEYGRSFATRPRGADVASSLADAARALGDSHLTVSFKGVSVISGSFADEFVLRLAAKAWIRHISFSDMDPAVAAHIRWAIEHSQRIAKSHQGASRLPELVA